MIYFDVTVGSPTILPLDDTVGIKRIVILNNGDPNSATELLLYDNSPVLLAKTELVDFTFPETPFGYPAPSCFLISVIGNSTGTVMIETSPFVNANYFEKREIT
nr:MAG TPA: hypothetical protein [Caudoviricetes sp.]